MAYSSAYISENGTVLPATCRQLIDRLINPRTVSTDHPLYNGLHLPDRLRLRNIYLSAVVSQEDEIWTLFEEEIDSEELKV